MITYTDCLLLLSELKKAGIDTSEITKKAISSTAVNVEVLKFINDNRQFEVQQFYEKLRYSYNKKKSKLYINIVKSDEVEEPKNVLITLSSLLTQILLFNNNINSNMFLKHSRAEEISKVLNNYFNTFDLIPCIKLLRLIKADLKAFEYIKNK